MNLIRNSFSQGAYYSINIDQRVMNLTKHNMSHNPNRYTYDEAQVNFEENKSNRKKISSIQDQIFNLMNRDTYARFLRSEAYKEILMGGKKKVSVESD